MADESFCRLREGAQSHQRLGAAQGVSYDLYLLAGLDFILGLAGDPEDLRDHGGNVVLTNRTCVEVPEFFFLLISVREL